MFTTREENLSIADILNEWSEEVGRFPTKEKLQKLLWMAFWRHEFPMVPRKGARTRLNLLKQNYKYDKHFTYTVEGEMPSNGFIQQSDGSLLVVDTSFDIPIPSRNSENWSEENCDKAFEAIARIPYSNCKWIIPSFLSVHITRTDFFQWLPKSKRPSFWGKPGAIPKKYTKKRAGGPKTQREKMREAVQKFMNDKEISPLTPIQKAYNMVIKMLKKEGVRGWSLETFRRHTRDLFKR